MEIDSRRMSDMVRNWSSSGAKSMANVAYLLNRLPAESTGFEVSLKTSKERGA